jgi:hypothetical protein
MDFRPGTITVISPDGGERLVPGDAYEITWSALEYEPTYPMTLTYSLDGGKTYSPILNAVNNIGKYIWRAPKTDSAKAMIRVSDGFNPAVYDASNAYFTIGKDSSVASLPQNDNEGEAISEIETEGEIGKNALKPYELLVKLGDNVLEGNPEEDKRGSYKQGDIVVVRPAGYNWSEAERRNFLVVQADLTEEEARELSQPGNEHLGRTRYKVNLGKSGLLAQKAQAMKGLLHAKPIVELGKEIEDKEKQK